MVLRTYSGEGIGAAMLLRIWLLDCMAATLVLLMAQPGWAQDPPPPPPAAQPKPSSEPKSEPKSEPVPQPAPVPSPTSRPLAKIEIGAPSKALELHDEAKVLYAKGKYIEAVAKLRRAVKIDPEGKELFYNLGLIQEKMGNLDAAIADYRRCFELESDPDEKLQLARIIKRLEGARHYTEFEPGDAPSSGGSAASPDGDGTDVGGATVSPWVWVGAGVSLASFSIAAILALRASDVDPGDDAMTGPDRSLQQLEDDADEAHSLAIGADVMLAVGVAASAVTVTIALVSLTRDDNTALRLGPTGAALTGRF